MQISLLTPGQYDPFSRHSLGTVQLRKEEWSWSSQGTTVPRRILGDCTAITGLQGTWGDRFFSGAEWVSRAGGPLP